MPLERRSIIEGPQLAELEKSNRLLTAHRYPQADGSVRYGNLEGVSVAPDAGWNGWNPRDLRIDFKTLQERYKEHPEQLTDLMKRAEKIEAAPGIKLSDYIRGLGDGKKLPAFEIPKAPIPKAPRPEPEPPLEPKKPEKKEKPANIQHPTPNTQQRTEEPQTPLPDISAEVAAAAARRLAGRLKRWDGSLSPEQIREILRLQPDQEAAFGFYTFQLDGRKVVIPAKMFQ